MTCLSLFDPKLKAVVRRLTIDCSRQLLPKDALLLNQGVDHVLLVAIDPLGEGQEQKPKG
jgi:hypothetical protein